MKIKAGCQENDSFYMVNILLLVRSVSRLSIKIFSIKGDEGIVQSWKKYMRQTLVFMSDSAIRKNLISIFQQFSASIKDILGLGGN